MTEIHVYSSARCPYCDRAKELLQRKELQYVEHRVDQDPVALEKMIALCDGRRSVPQIIINGLAIGGFDDLNALDQSGRLSEILNTTEE